MNVMSEQKEIQLIESKVCRLCCVEKNLNDFYIKINNPDGHKHICKECMKTIQKKYREKPGFKEKQKAYDKNRYEEKRDEILKRKKEYHIENREHILEHKKEYRNTEECKIKNKEWRTNNKERLANLQSSYREKYPHTIAWRSVLHSTLKRLGTIKEGHTIDILGYSATQLKEHIEKQFLHDMTWDNHGDWHIDHIKAVSNFPDDADIKEVCALSNLQPLWAFDNLSKSNR